MIARQPQMLQMYAVETGQMSSVETGQMSAVETGQMSAAETGQMLTRMVVRSSESVPGLFPAISSPLRPVPRPNTHQKRPETPDRLLPTVVPWFKMDTLK